MIPTEKLATRRLPMTTSDRERTMSEKMDELKAAWSKLWRDLFDALNPTWFGRLARKLFGWIPMTTSDRKPC